MIETATEESVLDNYWVEARKLAAALIDAEIAFMNTRDTSSAIIKHELAAKYLSDYKESILAVLVATVAELKAANESLLTRIENLETLR